MNNYGNFVGKEYEFYRGDKVPRWIFESDAMYFDSDILVVATKSKVYISGLVGEGEHLIKAEYTNGEISVQNCPQISYHTTGKLNSVAIIENLLQELEKTRNAFRSESMRNGKYENLVLALKEVLSEED